MVHKSIILILVFATGIFATLQASIHRITDVKSSGSRYALPDPVAAQAQKVKEARLKIQLALLLDTSGSMEGLIDQARNELWKIVNALSEAHKDSVPAELEIALYEYGNSGLSSETGYIRLVSGFTSDLDQISEKLFALYTNGGDEYCGFVIRTALQQLAWEEDPEALKLIFIAGNEPFTQGPVKYHDQCLAAKEKGIYVNTIHCGGHNEGVSTKWQDGALLAGGQYFHIDQHQQVVYMETPFDTQITSLNTSLNNTYIYYGESGATMKTRQKTQDENAAKHSKGNEVMRISSKSKSVYTNSHWDLVDAYNNRPEIVVEVDMTTLPDSLRNLSRDQLKIKITQYNKQRTDIQKQIAHLTTQREQWIVQQQSASTVSAGDFTLGASILRALKDQSSKKGFLM